MHSVIFWFRNDLRLQDQPALQQAAAHAERHGQRLLLVWVHDPAQDEATAWGFRRMGQHRRRFLAETLQDLNTSLQALGQHLVLLRGRAQEVLPSLAQRVNASAIYAEDIAAPEEQAQVQALRDAGLTHPMTVYTVWQSSLLAPDALSFDVADMPQVFTTFRQRVEAVGLQPLAPLAAPRTLPPPPPLSTPPKSLTPSEEMPGWTESPWALLGVTDAVNKRSFKGGDSSHFQGGESHALAHLHSYLTPPWPDRYKQTRNALQGQHTSSHWSPEIGRAHV